MLLSNHNNALMDALLIATSAGRFSYFLTRASVFKNRKVKWFLRSLNMLPVYRVRDGWSSIQNNNEIFDYCRELLHNGKVVSLFPEGNHNIKRTVRPLSKGFTRIVYETLDSYPDRELKIIPIGLNYQQADAFADSVSMIIGNPIDARTFMTADRNQDILHLKDTISENIKTLTTHIPFEDYDKHLAKLEGMQANFLNPVAVNTCLASNYQDCTFKPTKKPMVIKSFFKVLMIINLFVPYLIWKFVVQPKVKEIEFMATFRFAIVITLVPVWVLIIMLFIGSYIGGFYALVFLIATLLASLLAVKL
jgi:1-acyl-sn-glycerol-3-phosphate acyltransferase